MKIFTLLAALSLLLGSAFGQAIDRRALGTNSFFTTVVNAQNPNGGGVDSKLWTNDIPFATFQVVRPVYQNRTIWSENVGTNHSAVEVTLFNTNNQDTTFTFYGWNKSTNSFPTAPYWLGGSYGAVFENAPNLGSVKAGDGIGVLGVSDGLWSRQIGVSGLGLSTANNQTNIGVFGSALSAGTSGGARVGGYFETGDQTQGTITSPVITNSVVQANSRSGDFIFRGQTNGVSTIQMRADGSAFIGKNVAQDASMGSFNNIYFPYVVSMTESNEASQIGMYFLAVDSEDTYSVYGNASLSIQQPGSAILNLDADTGPERRFISVRAATGNDPIYYNSNNITLLEVSEDGGLSIIKGVNYSWPTGYGAETNSVLTDTNMAGSLSWQPGLLSPTGTNIIQSLVTNTVNNNARIGPGTNNVLAKFNVVGGTNVGNSPLISTTTNLIEMMQAHDGSSWTNSATNRMYGEYTGSGTNQYLESITPKGHNNEAAHIRHQAIGQVSQRHPIYINDSIAIEPITNQLIGHPVGGMYPLTGSTGAGLQSLGFSTQPFLDIWASRMFGTTGLSSGPQFGSGVGGTGFGLTTDNTMLQFFRDTGITAAFNKERNSGSLHLDLAGNGLGFGSGISNTIAGFVNSAIVGLVQVGETNSGSATPTAQGLMAAQATGTDKGGSDFRLVGGPSTGTGTNGNVRIQTAEKANSTSTSLNSSFKDRVFVIADPIILTTNSATIVANITIPTALRGVGGQVIAHTEIENGVDIATTDETFMFTANRKGSTVVTGISAPVTCTSTSGGSAAIANTWTAVANSTSVDLKLTCVTSGILSTNSTVRVTIIPNSSAVPIITHP